MQDSQALTAVQVWVCPQQVTSMEELEQVPDAVVHISVAPPEQVAVHVSVAESTGALRPNASRTTLNTPSIPTSFLVDATVPPSASSASA